MTQQQLLARALRLSYFTMAYNVVEGLVSVAAGLLGGLFREGRETIREGKLCCC